MAEITHFSFKYKATFSLHTTNDIQQTIVNSTEVINFLWKVTEGLSVVQVCNVWIRIELWMH